MERAAAMTDMYDQALLGVLQHVDNVQEFLNILFGFLYRKTDFYRLLLQPTDRLGFPPGVAKGMTLRVSASWAPLRCPRGAPIPPTCLARKINYFCVLYNPFLPCLCTEEHRVADANISNTPSF